MRPGVIQQLRELYGHSRHAGRSATPAVLPYKVGDVLALTCLWLGIILEITWATALGLGSAYDANADQRLKHHIRPNCSASRRGISRRLFSNLTIEWLAVSRWIMCAIVRYDVCAYGG